MQQQVSQSQLTIRTFALGEWRTNCYVVHGTGSASGADCWIIDAGIDPRKMIEYIRGQNLSPQAILLTHAHIDHIAGLADFRALWPQVPILIHEAERDFLSNPSLNLGVGLDDLITIPDATGFLSHEQRLQIAGLLFEVRHVPGHSPGGVTFYQADEKVAFVGDALFAGSIGNTSFPTSDHDLLMRSLHEQLLTLPDETRGFQATAGPRPSVRNDEAIRSCKRQLATDEHR